MTRAISRRDGRPRTRVTRRFGPRCRLAPARAGERTGICLGTPRLHPTWSTVLSGNPTGGFSKATNGAIASSSGDRYHEPIQRPRPKLTSGTAAKTAPVFQWEVGLWRSTDRDGSRALPGAEGGESVTARAVRS
jgi:hypothetical protein